MDDEKTKGLATAITEAVDPASAPPTDQPTQLPLLPAQEILLLPEDPALRRQEILSPRGRGRPPGSRNRSTEAWRQYLLHQYESPLVGLAEIYSRPVADLAAELGCSKAEAFRMQMVAMKELAPYMHGKMPLEIEATVDVSVDSLASRLAGARKRSQRDE